MEDVGQSAADAIGACECRSAARRMGIAAQRLAGLEHLCRIDDWLADAAAYFFRYCAAPLRRQDAQPLSRPPQRYLACCVPDGLPDNLPCIPGMADDRRDQSNAVSPVREPAEPASVGHCRSGEPTLRAG